MWLEKFWKAFVCFHQIYQREKNKTSSQPADSLDLKKKKKNYISQNYWGKGLCAEAH